MTLPPQRRNLLPRPYKHCHGCKNANGEMYAALFDFAYLSAVRARDARSLKWADVAETEILIEPTKMRESSGAKIAIVITQDIQAVLDRAKSLGKVKRAFTCSTRSKEDRLAPLP
jgi:integrase